MTVDIQDACMRDMFPHFLRGITRTTSNKATYSEVLLTFWSFGYRRLH